MLYWTGWTTWKITLWTHELAHIISLSFVDLFTSLSASLSPVPLLFAFPFRTFTFFGSVFFFFQGMIAGHAYYFLEDVYPRMTGRRPLRTPSFIKALFADEPVVVARPGNVRFAAPAADDVLQG